MKVDYEFRGSLLGGERGRHEKDVQVRAESVSIFSPNECLTLYVLGEKSFR